jgi:hypothetical protein
MGTRTRPNPARLQYALNRGGSQYWEKSIKQNGITHRRPTFTRSWAFLFLLASKFADCRIRSYNKPMRTFDDPDITWQRLLYDDGTDEVCH